MRSEREGAPATAPTPGATLSRRTVLRAGGAGMGLFLLGAVGGRAVAVEVPAAALPGGTLDPARIPKYVTPLAVPPVMPRSGRGTDRAGEKVDHYVIAVRQVRQQILPAGLPATTVWAYGPVDPGNAPDVHHTPSPTIEARHGRRVRVTWVNDLVDDAGGHLPHLLPVDPTLHWANPPGGTAGRDSPPVLTATPPAYDGPVPMVTHVHGAVGVGDESDGYAEAWYLPDADDIDPAYAREGTWYAFFAEKAQALQGSGWSPGTATFEYPNTQRASTLWYHDHTLGMARVNVYAGPAGFYLVRGGPDGDRAVRDSRTGRRAVLPGPAPGRGDRRSATGPYREIPLVVQDRSFNTDGSLFYPDTRRFFDQVPGPYVPHSDVPPIWNPEFFGSTLVVNGRTWPYLDVEQRRYRFRLLNGCNSRFLILDFSAVPGASVWQIGSEAGFLPRPVEITGARNRSRLLLGPAERADVILDLTGVPVGHHVLRNVGPDAPFGGGEPVPEPPDEDDDARFLAADPGTTGQVLQLRVTPARGPDRTTPPQFLALPPIAPLTGGAVRRLALVERMSGRFEDAPSAALLGRVEEDGHWVAHDVTDPVTENPGVGSTETWELYNTTGDAHPIHVHAVAFQVLGRQPVVVDEGRRTVVVASGSQVRPPEPGEEGWKETVIAYPGEVTRLRMRFTVPGQFVWHCPILEHEDNQMMRPYRVGPPQEGQPGHGGGHPGH
ncbi:FtsP/CotA-like multicopper oxidase with cupredoxin domain [Georgenia soli]|uniref:FtsP/CotA-like multicopper oxidase with cupredoxin domain n=1 Tax=Georgenia soli TaxID=638953 RepID=A0A2A9EIN2_9MICO|nr:multicopper oxidase [Georgenia soli]PFG38115.1 FtsP/CotA-like multicopper oxidase with cupredoxin domain [Georgenia soli]